MTVIARLIERAVTEPGLSAGFDLIWRDALMPRDESRGASPFLFTSAHVAEDFARGIMPGNASDAAAGMRSGAAHVQALERAAIVAVPEHRPRRKQLVEGKRAVKKVAADEPEFTLEIQRRECLRGNDARSEVRSVAIDGLDHEPSDFGFDLVPRTTLGKLRVGVLAKQARDMLARRRQRGIDPP